MLKLNMLKPVLRFSPVCLPVCLLLVLPLPGLAQDEHPGHMEMEHVMPHADGEVEKKHDMEMTGNFGPYVFARESSGTSWQPDSTPHEGMHFMAGDWTMMAHGYVNGVYDHQGGKRGDDKAFSSSMGMLMAQRQLGSNDKLGARAMLSLDPLMGRNGYPLLFATGETADGHNPLVDRQHPHELFMELSGSYSHAFTPKTSAFMYGGVPGEPALGPPAFMHRFSGMDNPEAPLTHHWLDSTHITFGVVTGGIVHDRWKIEASGFKGREPGKQRYDIEKPGLDSASARLSYNPARDWSLQISWGHLHSPEELHPDKDENRLIASGTYNRPFGGGNNWATTAAWGRKFEKPGRELDAFLVESAVSLSDTHTFFARAERADESELFENDSILEGEVIPVNKATAGYIRDFRIAEHVKFGVGGLASGYLYPDKIDRVYGSNPVSYMLFVRLKLL
ncbi:MAG: hypothetical protein PHY92_05775 [Alphaproteobacteria bacterium]|nr:hypothetical protein [Alphaproteobacteria bacterium]